VGVAQALRVSAVLAAGFLLLAGCSGSSAESAGSVVLPPVTGAADYQLGGAYTPASGVTVVTRDSTSTPAPGIYSICYVNGFQTQPGVSWPSHLVLHTASGAALIDPGWPDEQIIDISTATKRTDAAGRLAKTIDGCADKHFAAVEFDNLDSWTRSTGALTKADAIAFATLLVARAHRSGLAAGQKNTSELGRVGPDTIGFDFAVSEECDQFSECSAYTKVYGEHVINIEYGDELRRPFAAVCAAKSTPALTILRDRNLVASGQAGYLYHHC
jgi:hypothetical protein